MSRLRPFLAALAALAALGALTTAAGQGQGSSTQYFTWFGATGGPSALYTVVYDAQANDTFVLERDATTGTVRERFGGGFVAGGIAASPSGRVDVAASDGTVRVFSPRPSGHVQTASHTITVPGQSGAVTPTGIARTPNGFTLVSITVEGAQPLDPPAFAGVALLDRSGSTVATWQVPSGSLPQNAWVLPATLTRAPGGDVFVGGIPCLAGACGDIVSADGYLYRLAVDTDASGTPAIATAATWQSSDLVSVTSAQALDATNLVVAGGGIGAGESSAAPLPGSRTLAPPGGVFGGEAYQLGLSGGQVQVVGTLRGLLDPSSVALSAGATGTTAYLVEDTPPSASVDSVIIGRFGVTGTTWTRQGLPWVASWGSSGPPVVRCGGRPATIVGTSGADVISGTAGPDVIASLGGDDVVRALGGDDVICLGDGADVAFGGSGDDRVLAGAGADMVDGRGGDDLLAGGSGADRLQGGSGADDLRGGTGSDLVRGDAGDDVMRGQEADDVLIGGAGADRASGGPGGDVCLAEATTSC